MKTSIIAMLLPITLCCLGTVSCSDSDKVAPATYDVSGRVEKGPFVSGSTITVQPMNSKLQVLGNMFSTSITDNAGNFTLGAKEFNAPYAEMTATGYFFNEVKGALSNGVLVLRSLVDLSDNSTVNVNILTHLKYARIKKLVEGGKSFKEANNEAQLELLSAFGLKDCCQGDASQFSITAGTDESAALIAVSCLLMLNRTEGALTEYLSSLSQEFAQSGTFSDTTKTQFQKDKKELAGKLSDIRKNIIQRYSDLGMNIKVKDPANYIDWDNDGTAGNETLKGDNKVVLDKTEIAVPKEGGLYQIAINSPIPVYTVAPMDTNCYNSSPTLEIYEHGTSLVPAVEKSITNKTLTVNVGKACSRKEQNVKVNLYDCLGNVVATVNLKIAGDKTAKIPLLGYHAKNTVSAFALSLTNAFFSYNTLEQFYRNNKRDNQLPLSADNTEVANCWYQFYQASKFLLFIKDYDARAYGIYQDYIDVLYALCYYPMVVAWGNVPYNYGNLWTESTGNAIPRTAQSSVLSDLKSRLIAAMNNLDEKKNQSLTDLNGLFFVSKDVARIALANIYMYEGNWSEAKPLLAKVMENSFYQLDRTNDNYQGGNGIIFGLNKDDQILPIQTISDVYLSSAECEYHSGSTTTARNLLLQVSAAKGITVSSDILTGIKEARAQVLSYSDGYFAFLKRNGMAKDECSIQSYELLFPIPAKEVMMNTAMKQNPGY